MARLYREKGDYERVAPLYERALALIEKGQDAQAAALVMPLDNYTYFIVQRGEYARAGLLFERALSRRVLPPAAAY